MRIYYPPSLRGFEPRRMVFSSWVEHMPFAYDIVAAVEPRMLIELGAYNALSYFTFCQSVVEHGLNTRCYAVDTWVGDKHTEGYGEEVFASVAEHNAAHYADFSELLRMTFNEALPRFEDECADIIHLDGLHTYEAVLEDFTNWYPKLRPGGVFLFHDIRARLKDFGVWRLWETLEREHQTFSFNHGFGLGVLRKPGGGPLEQQSALVQALFDPAAVARQRLRQFYAYIARHMELRRKQRRLDREQGGESA